VTHISDDENPNKCTGCKSENSPAVARCYDCSNYLCSNCVMAHQFMHCFEGHRVIYTNNEVFLEPGEIRFIMTLSRCQSILCNTFSSLHFRHSRNPEGSRLTFHARNILMRLWPTTAELVPFQLASSALIRSTLSRITNWKFSPTASLVT
jgi:hypothetical protein